MMQSNDLSSFDRCPIFPKQLAHFAVVAVLFPLQIMALMAVKGAQTSRKRLDMSPRYAGK